MVEGESGKKDEWAFFMSLKQRWFSMVDAKSIVDSALEHGLLEEKDGLLTPTFIAEDVSPPAFFTPAHNLAASLKGLPCMCAEDSKKKENNLEKIVGHIHKKTGMTEASIWKSFRKTEETTRFSEDVAGLLVALKMDVDISSFLEDVEVKLESPNTVISWTSRD